MKKLLLVVVAFLITVSVGALVVLVGTTYAFTHPTPAGPVVTPYTYSTPGPTGGPR